VDIDTTTLLAIASALATAIAGVVGTLWRTSQRAQAAVIAQITEERNAERGESARLQNLLSELQERRLEDVRTMTREILEHVNASRAASEESAASLDAIRAMLGNGR